MRTTFEQACTHMYTIHTHTQVPGAVGPDGRSRIRADSINPETMPELDDVHSEKEQDIEVVEGHSDHEDN